MIAAHAYRMMVITRREWLEPGIAVDAETGHVMEIGRPVRDDEDEGERRG